MARAALIQTGFNNGEISPLMYGRTDIEKYPLSVRECTNMLVTVQGPASKRDGSRFVAPIADESSTSLLFEFEFSPTQGYIIEINGNRARFFTNRGIVIEGQKSVTGITQANPAVVTVAAHGYANGDQVVFPVVGPYGKLVNQVFNVAGVTTNTFQLSGYNGTSLPAFSGSPKVARVYSIPAPYAAADLPAVSYLQTADTMTLTHGAYQTQKLVRSGATNWAFSDFVFKDGPYLTEDTQGTTLTPSDTGSLTPAMTSNTAPSGTASTSSASSSDYAAFDRNLVQRLTVASGGVGFIRYQVPGAARVVDAYWITSAKDVTGNNDNFTAWKFQGSNDGVNWVTLDTRRQETGWANSETRYYTTLNKAAFTYYQIAFTGGGGDDGSQTSNGEVSFNIAAQDQTPFSLTASSTTGINDGRGFLSTDLGRTIRLMGSDGRWRWAEITTVTSTTVVQIRLHGHALPDTSPISRWRLGMFSDTTGWPSCSAYYQDRQVFNGPPSFPNYVCFSTSGVYDTFTPSEDDGTVTDASGFAYAMIEQQVTAINWFQPVQRGLIIGTAEGEAIAQSVTTSTTSQAIFSPLNFKVTWPTNYGSAPVRPRQVDTAMLFLDRRRKRVHEMSYQIDVDSFTAPNLNAMADHITVGGINRLAFLRQPNRILFGARSDGRMTGLSYERDQEVAAWHSHVLGGTNSQVTDVASIASPDGLNEDLWMIVNRTIGGVTRKYIEYIGDWWWHDTAQADACFVDGSVKYSGSPVTVVGGLAHLEGETVRVLADGNQQADQVVTGGQITLTKAASVVTVGLPYKARLWTLRPTQGSQNGTAQGKMKRIFKYALRLYRSLGGKIGDDRGRLDELPYWTIANSFLHALGLFSGDIGPKAFPGGWELDGGTVFENDTAYPFTVIAYMPQIVVEDA